MRVYRWLLGVGCAVLSAGSAIASPSECGLSKITGSGELHEALSFRAVEVVRRAAHLNDSQTALITPTASFSLGAGDVGRPLGTGVAGARQLALTMKADTYRFLGWDYMDRPTNPCSKHTVEVEFIDNQKKWVSRVQFTFEAGRVVEAAGWQRSFETGLLADAPAN